MAIQRRISVRHRDVFPAGAFLVSEVEPVLDFQAAVRPDGSRPQKTDPDTGLLVWSVQVLDADEAAGKRDKTVSVKLLGPHQPVPPKNDTPFPFRPVEFAGLTALPYVDETGARARIAWSFRAEAMTAPAATPAKAA
jgi:hypothetical protein